MTESTRVSVGLHVRVVRPSPLEGLAGAVTFVNDSDRLYEVRIDGGSWRGRPPVLVTRDEVELVALATRAVKAPGRRVGNHQEHRLVSVDGDASARGARRQVKQV